MTAGTHYSLFLGEDVTVAPPTSLAENDATTCLINYFNIASRLIWISPASHYVEHYAELVPNVTKVVQKVINIASRRGLGDVYTKISPTFMCVGDTPHKKYSHFYV